METFARPTLDSAVNIAPGVNSQISGNSRNEQNIYVRGFDRWQVPLTVDGVRVYLPVDNKLDFARFLTADHDASLDSALRALHEFDERIRARAAS